MSDARQNRKFKHEKKSKTPISLKTSKSGALIELPDMVTAKEKSAEKIFAIRKSTSGDNQEQKL